MAHESFEDEEIACLLNERFVSIKVDREERPDIDSIYMKACQAMTGQGGWPLSVFLTSDQVPFYAGTYFPKESRYGLIGFKDLIIQLSDQYQHHRGQIEQIAEQMKQVLQSRYSEGVIRLSEDTLHRCFQQLKDAFDPVYGGFGDAPKFPIPHQLLFLLRYYHWTKEETAKNMVHKTLRSMAKGGIYDHIGFGFSRYSVDEMWLVPHFEKMLYDNALLTIAYVEAYQVTKDPYLKQIAQEIITYVLRDMQHEEGGFYSAEDADSEGEEGKFYLWTPNEVIEILGEDLGSLFCNVYDISRQGNFERKNIPNMIQFDLETFAITNGLKLEKLIQQIDEAKKKLFIERKKRTPPFKDDKILTSWNSLMIAALAKAARVLENDAYLDAAKKALQFIEKHLLIDKRLMVRYREGEVKEKGFIDDYAFLLWGYLEMYEATLEASFLQKALDLVEQMDQLFWDGQDGAYFFYGNDHEQLLARPKEAYDGAIPSGNSVAAYCLARLGSLTGDHTLSEKAAKMLEAFSKQIDAYPVGHTFFLQALWYKIVPTKEVVIIANENTENHLELIKMLRTEYFPEVTYLVHNGDPLLVQVAPFVDSYSQINQQTTIYVCENFTCNEPTTDIEKAKQLIQGKE